MAASFVGAASATRGNSGTITIDGSGLGIQNGDFLLTFIAGRSNVDPTTLAGWTPRGSYDTGSDPSQFLYSREASGESGSYTWTLGDGGTGILLVYRDVTWDTVGSWVRVASGTLNISGVTALAGALVALYSYDSNSVTWTPPSGMTERADVQGSNSEAQTVGVADLLPNSAGATGTKSPTPSSTSNAQAGVLVSLKNLARVDVTPASYAVSTSSVGLNRGYVATQFPGGDFYRYNFSLKTVGLTYDRPPLTVSPATYALTLGTVAFQTGYAVAPESATFAVGAVDAALIAARLASAAAADAAIGAGEAGLSLGRYVTATRATYTVTALNADINAATTYTVQQSGGDTLTVTQRDAEMLRGLRYASEAGEINVEPRDVDYLVTRLLSAGTRSYALALRSAVLHVDRLVESQVAGVALEAASVLFDRTFYFPSAYRVEVPAGDFRVDVPVLDTLVQVTE